METDNLYILKTKDFGKVIEQSYYKYKTITKEKESSKEEKERSKRSRACSRIKEIVYCNNFDYFFTLTIKSDFRVDIEYSIRYLIDKINYYSKRGKTKGVEVKYIYVFELTKNKGVHLHGFISGLYDLYLNKYNHLSSLYFDNVGFQNIVSADKVNPNYLIKYIMKSPTYLKQLYHASRGLNKPIITLYHDRFNRFLDFPFTFKNKFCKMITYKVGD